MSSLPPSPSKRNQMAESPKPVVVCGAKNCLIDGSQRKAVLLTHGFRCNPCNNNKAFHFKCVGSLDSFLNKNGTMESKIKEFYSLANVNLLCQECTTKDKANNILQASPISSDIKAMTQSLKKVEDKFAALEQLEQGLESLKMSQEAVSAFLGLAPQHPTHRGQVPDDGDNNDAPPARPTYASMAKKGNNILSLVTNVVERNSKKASLEDIRSRSIVIDGLRPAEGKPLRQQVEEILTDLDLGNMSILEIFRLGTKVGNDSDNSIRPRKVKVIFSTIAERARSTSGATNYKLRQEDFEATYGKIYISPSEPADIRRLLWMLRRRRDHLNRNIPSEANSWVVDRVRRRLLKKVGGSVDFSVTDDGFKTWATNLECPLSKEDKAEALLALPSPRRANQRFGGGGRDRRASGHLAGHSGTGNQGNFFAPPGLARLSSQSPSPTKASDATFLSATDTPKAKTPTPF